MGKVLMKGNEAIAEAAIRAGCLNYFAYPITPQSEVAEYLSKRLPEVGGVFLQGESEVAVSYMIFGAAAAGARVFTTSSSPGISLMSEGISYITAAQCPAVFVNIMRGGPGLGGILPSQADYFQSVKGGGHGDYRLLVLAPASVQEAVEMVMPAFPLAEKYRNPVMILGDGLIGQMMEPVEFPDHLKSAPSNKDEWATSGLDTRKSTRAQSGEDALSGPGGTERPQPEAESQVRPHAARGGALRNLQPRRRLPGPDRELRHHEPGVPHRHRQLQGKGRRGRHGPAPDPFPVSAAGGLRRGHQGQLPGGHQHRDEHGSAGGGRGAERRGAKPVHWYGKCGGEVPTPEEVMEVIAKLMAS